ncbi:MAG: glycoside hydrolase [Deferribacteres bacterium]|nr:glycoside hydrolase [Deferribacteres bacterium]
MGEKKCAKKPGAGRGNGKKSTKSNGNYGIKKQYLNAGTKCRVTFRLPKQAAPDAKVVTVVGDFNNWNVTEAQMERLKSGDFKLTLELPSNKEYRFRYLIDFNRWENDWCADQYVPNPFGCDDSLVIV